MKNNYEYQKRLIAKVGGIAAWNWDFSVERWSLDIYETKILNISYIREWAKESGLPFNPADWDQGHITVFKLTFGI